ncbi:MAG: hypothetical protein ACR2JY_16420 [Chloroflexota bacterium]
MASLGASGGRGFAPTPAGSPVRHLGQTSFQAQNAGNGDGGVGEPAGDVVEGVKAARPLDGVEVDRQGGERQVTLDGGPG